MAYTARDAVQTFLGYINKNKNNVEFIPETSGRGLILEESGEKSVIFVYPISHKADDSKNFFDTRDSGAKERGIAWQYAFENDLKYFCVAVHNEVERYIDYIFSLESNESIVATVSGTLDGKRNGPGTQVVIPNDFAPKKSIERIKTRNNFYITAVHKDEFFNYLRIFDNRPYTHEYDLETLKTSFAQDSTIEKKDLSDEFKVYLRDVAKVEDTTIASYVGALRGKLFDETKEDVGEVDIYSISDLIEFSMVLEQLNNSTKYKEINERSHRRISSSLIMYEKFLNWRKKPHQRIFFGAPGTGKSFILNKEAKEYFGNNYERVTFHPSYMYGNFVGAFKPYPKKIEKNGEIEETITYEYVEGPFMRLLVNALSNPNSKYLLLIEEINRANVAAVFGDVFQLLDRNQNGESEYSIATSKDQRLFLEKANKEIGDDKLKNILGENFETLYLPSNFYIWATMNSADQGVMPMDTAFRRRWDFTYLGIDEAVKGNEKDFENYKIKISSNEIALWNDFRVAINHKLAFMNIPEDKFIGPYFISKSVLETSDIDQLTGIVKNKVIMYLYEDVAKGRRNELFEDNKHSTYSQVCLNFDKDAKNLFKNGLDLETTVINEGTDENEIYEANLGEE